jgi:hypothetical protein
MQNITSSAESYWIIFSAYDGNQNRHRGDLEEHIGLLLLKVACSKCDVLSQMF